MQKKKLFGAAALALSMAFTSCHNNQQSKTASKMEQAKVIEMVLFKVNENINPEEAQKELITLNDFLAKQEGFIERKTAIAEDGHYLDIVYWTDLTLAKTASEKAMQDQNVTKVFSNIHQEEMIFKHFKVFNDTDQINAKYGRSIDK